MNWIRRLLDINRPVVRAERQVTENLTTTDSVRAEVHHYEAPGSEVTRTVLAVQGSMPWWRQVVLYLSSVVGVLVSSSVVQYGAGATPTLSVTVGIVLLAMVIGCVTATFAYRYVNADRNGPILAQLGWYVGAGMLWQTVLALVKELLTKLAGLG